MGIEDLRSTGLVLGLGFTSTVDHASPVIKSNVDNDNYSINNQKQQRNYHHDDESKHMEPSLTLSLSGDTYNNNNKKKIDMNTKAACHEDNNNNNNINNNQSMSVSMEVYRQASSPHSHSHSAVSSFSSPRVKRERDLSSEEVEIERVACSKASDEDEDGVNARKKLRLTKDQSALLEESFKQHSTLNPKQKQALARQLNLRPRQVEVWFQNRRARTKLKQTEVDCEFLKKCCETLTDENRRLQKELQELKALKLAQPMYMHMPAATLTMCPSCERIGGGVGDVVAGAKTPFSVVTKPHFCNPFSNQSAAC